MESYRGPCGAASCAQSPVLRGATTRPWCWLLAKSHPVAGGRAPLLASAVPIACAGAATPRSAVRCRTASGWDDGAAHGYAPLIPPSLLAGSEPTCCIPPGARSRAGRTVPSSSSPLPTTAPQTACAFPPLRSLSKACSFVAAFGERTNLSTICPVWFVNYVPGPDPGLTHGLRRGLDTFFRRFAAAKRSLIRHFSASRLASPSRDSRGGCLYVGVLERYFRAYHSCRSLDRRLRALLYMAAFRTRTSPMIKRVFFSFTLVLAVAAHAASDKPGTTGRSTKSAGPRFEISFSREMSPAPLDGHVLLLISNNDEKEPRFQISYNTTESQQVFGVDVDGLAAGTPAVVDASTLGYPAESLNDLAAGDYWVQGLINIYETFHLANGHTVKLPPEKGEGQHWQVKPGNLYSKPQKLHLDPKAGQTIRISLTEKVPAVEEEPKIVDSVVGWSGANDQHVIADNKWVKHIRIQSELLTKFWGRPTYLGAVVLLPDGWEEHPEAHYPLIVEQDHFSRDLPGVVAFRTEPPSPDLKGGELRAAKSGYKLYQDWTAGRLPRVIVLTIQHATPYFDDSYAVNSENVGPYGDAITQELIPYVEKRFRGIGDGWARAVYGGSTGGWEALASQVFYADFYNGAWVFCPDVVDFRAYITTNIYADKKF